MVSGKFWKLFWFDRLTFAVCEGYNDLWATETIYGKAIACKLQQDSNCEFFDLATLTFTKSKSSRLVGPSPKYLSGNFEFKVLLLSISRFYLSSNTK